MSDIAAENPVQNPGQAPGQLIASAERVVYEGAELRLTQLDLDLPDGERIWWDTVRLLRTVSVALVDSDDRVFLLHRSRLIQGRWGWELPGGIVDTGEDPRESAVRELAEAGYQAGRLTLVQSLQAAPHSVEGERLIFIGRDPVPTKDPGPEVGTREWTALDTALQRIRDGQIWDSATLVALLGILGGAW